jgi:hypothetical protein
MQEKFACVRCKILTAVPTTSENFIGQGSACSEIVHIQCSVQLSGMWLCVLVKTAKLLEEEYFYLGGIDEDIV